MVNKFSRFQLREEEDYGVKLEVEDVSNWREECQKSLLGKIWGVKDSKLLGS